MRIHASRPLRVWLLLAVLLPLLCLAGCAARPAADRAVAAAPSPVPPAATLTPVPTPSPTFTPTSTPTGPPTPTPSLTVSGTYDNLAENPNGTFHLRREAGVVYATFQTDRSPVQFLSRDQPEVLFTVPEGFRPVLPVTWEVRAEPALPDGTPLSAPAERRVFRMHVDTAGQVRYVDDAGVDGVGHLGYDTTLAWPLAGTEPQVCDRPRHIREGILAAVQALDDVRMPCSLVDWEHLARIRTLSPGTHAADYARHDLLGLTNLVALRMPSIHGTTYPDDLLAHTPRLQTLRIERNALEDLPANLFRYTPRLTHLSLGNDSRRDLDLPGALLMHTPHLESLQLESRHPAELARQLLAHTPHLTRRRGFLGGDCYIRAGPAICAVAVGAGVARLPGCRRRPAK